MSDFIGRLEKVYQTGFGRENLSKETREMLLFGQLHEGLSYILMESPAVSGALNYKELCLAAKREERRLAELKKKQQYLKVERPPASNSGNRSSLPTQRWSRSFRRAVNNDKNKTDEEGIRQQKQLRCYVCGSPNHLVRQRQQRNSKTESPGKKTVQSQTPKSTGTRVIRTGSQMEITKSGCCYVTVMIEGVAVSGLIDIGSDITIIRGDLLGGLEIQSLKPAEQKACTYDQKPITLDGQMTMKVSFGDKTIVTTVYVKLVAPDRLLLSETVCRLLGIVIHHPNVQSVERCQPEEDHPNVLSVERC